MTTPNNTPDPDADGEAVAPQPSVPAAVAPTPSVPAKTPEKSDDADEATVTDTPRPQAPRPMPEVKASGPAPSESGAIDAVPPQKHNGAPPAPPWQRAESNGRNGGGEGPRGSDVSREPQREPQSNLFRPGQSPVKGRPDQAPSRSLSEMAAKAARKEAAMVKSVGIDGPTRSIARPELIKDMPDLSELRHPTPPSTDTGPQPAVPSVPFHAVSVPSSTGPIPVVIPDGEPLRTTVQLRRIDPWSTLKVSLVLSVVGFFVWMIAVGLLYLVLDGMGVWGRLNHLFTDAASDSGSDSLISAGQVFGYAGLFGLISVVLLTGLSTIGAFIYNQCSDLVGGVQLTLADPD